MPENSERKTLYLIGGTMGVGKTTVCQILKKKMEKAVFLDGDWCWDADPFQVTEETKAMVMDNICHLLNNFLTCGAFENVVFCWVLHQREILDGILARLDTRGWEVRAVALTSTKEALAARHQRDVAAGERDEGSLARALAYLPLYGELGVPLLDTSACTAPEAAVHILSMRN